MTWGKSGEFVLASFTRRSAVSPVDVLACLILGAIALFVAWQLLIVALAIIIAPFYWAYRFIRAVARLLLRAFR